MYAKEQINQTWRQVDVFRDDYVLLSDVCFPVQLICELPAHLDIDLTTNSFMSLFTKNNALNFAFESAKVPKVRFSVNFALEFRLTTSSAGHRLVLNHDGS